MSPTKRKPKRPAVAREAAAPYGKQKPVYFLSLDVENVRCFGKKQTLKLTKGNGSPAPWTIILGENGTGKTTLLQCLVGMEPVEAPDFASEQKRESAYWPKHLFETPLVKQTFQRSATVSYKAQTRITRDEVLNQHVATSDSDSTGILGYGGPGAAHYAKVGKEYSELRCYAYGAARRPGPASLSEPSEESRCAGLFNESEDLINPQEWMIQADYRALKGVSLAKTQLGLVEDTLISLLPDVTDIRVPRPRDLQDTPRAEFKTPYGWVGFNQLGFGYRSMITWVVDFAVRLFRRYPDSPNPLAEPAVCLVDEIDLHMHPTWQREMIQYLSKHFTNTQFIATAHSPLVIQAAEDANIVLLRKEGDQVLIENDMNIVKGWRVDQILTSDLFGLPSARPPQYDKLYTRRVELAMKAKLTAPEQKEFDALNEEMAGLPLGESVVDRQTLALMDRLTKALEQRGNGGDSNRTASKRTKNPRRKGTKATR